MTEQSTFSGVEPSLCGALERRGFSALTAVQRAVLDGDIQGRDLRISSQTGSGKTVAIGLALARELVAEPPPAAGARSARPQALILAPTRELAAQVCAELSWLFEDLPRSHVMVVTGGSDIVREQRGLARGPRVLVATPGRLLDHVRSGAVDLAHTRQVVLDEADRMLEMGFRDELEAILENLPAERRTHLVSATFPRPVLDMANRFQGEWLHVQGTELGTANTDIEHVAHVVGPRDRYAALVNTLLITHGQRCLVFVQRRADAAGLSEQLAGDGFGALPFSGDLSQAQRTRTLEAFRRGVITTLVATDVAARGIDIADISTVVHWDLPEDAASYTHRSGRTGRAGQRGRSVLLVVPGAARRIERTLHAARIEATWSPAPDKKQIAKSVTKAARRRLQTALRIEEPPTELELTYARSLLAEHDPEVLVARLLELAKTPLPCEPESIENQGHLGQVRDATRTTRNRSGAPPRFGRPRGAQGQSRADARR